MNDEELEIFARDVIKKWNELAREAFPELNGLPAKEPENKYAKIMRDISGIDE